MRAPAYRIAVVLLVATSSSLLGSGFRFAEEDLARLGDESRSSALPILLVIMADQCGFCERMHQEFLADPIIRAFLDTRALVAVYDRDLGGKIGDFDGERVRVRNFLSRYDIFATPTLLFLDADGRQVAESLVGYNNREDYLALVAERLQDAQLAVAAGDHTGAAVVATLHH